MRLFAAAVATLSAFPAHSAVNTFTNGTSWNSATDWNSGEAPASTDGLLFAIWFPATTTLDATFTADTLSFNSSGTMAIDANASGTTARTLTLNNTTTNANGASDIISLLDGGAVNFGVTASKGITTLMLAASTNNISVANGGTFTFGANSTIGGAGKALSFTGNNTGKLVLDAANSYTGGFTLNSGTVIAFSPTSLGTTAGTLSLNGGALDLQDGTANQTENYNAVVGGSTSILPDRSSSGAGIQHSLNTLSIGNQTLTINKGLNVSSGNARINFGNTTFTGAATFDTENSSILVIGVGGNIAGNQNILFQSSDGTGTASIRAVSASPRSAGVTTLASGTLALNSSSTGSILGATGTTLQLNGGTLDLQLDGPFTAYPATVGGNVKILSDKATPASAGISTVLGPLSIGASTLTVSGGAAVTSGSANLAFGATTLTGNATLLVTNSGVGTSTTTLTLGGVSDGGLGYGITKAGGSTLILNSANTYGGDTRIQAGTVALGNNLALQNSALDTSGAGAVTLAATTPTFGGLKGGAALASVITNGYSSVTTLALNPGTGVTNTYSGSIANGAANMNLVKIGAGTQVLSGANTYSGNTTISAGTLALGPGGSIASTAKVSIAAGATFDVSAAGITLSGSNPQQTLAASSASGAATINAPSQTVTLNPGALLSFQAAGGPSTTLGRIDALGASANLTLSANAITVNVTGSALAVGTYRLLDCTGTLTGMANSTPTIIGTALSSGYTATVSTTTGAGGHVDLIVQATPTFTGLSSKVITYGTTGVSLSGTVSSTGGATTVYPANGDTVSATINGHTVNGAVNNGTGGFSIFYNDASLATDGVGGSPYPVAYAYGGNSSQYLNGSPNNTSTSLTVSKANPAVTVNVGSYAYNGSAQGPNSVTTPSTGSVNYSYTGVSVTYGPGGTPPTMAGSYTVTATVAADVNYNGASSGAAAFTINQAGTAVAITSSENPSGYQDSVIFTAPLPFTASGNVIFKTNSVLFDLETLSGGSATSTNSTLPRGTNVVTVEYAGDENYTGSTNSIPGGQTVTNHPPVAGNVTNTYVSGTAYLINIASLLTNNVTDADGDTITLSAVGVSTNGMTQVTNGTYILFRNTNSVNDQFTYTVDDGFGGSATGTIFMVVDVLTNIFGQNSPVITATGGAALVTFYGIPGESYTVWRSATDVSGPYEPVWTTNAPAQGRFIFTDDPAPFPMAYYKLSHP